MISFAGPVKGIFATLREILKWLLAFFVIKSEDVFLIGSIQVATRPDCVHTLCGGEADPTIIESDAMAIATIENNNKERDRLLEDWKAVRRQKQECTIRMIPTCTVPIL